MTDATFISPYLTDSATALDMTVSDTETSESLMAFEPVTSESFEEDCACQDCDGSVMCHAQLLFMSMQAWVTRQLARPLPAILLVVTSSILWTAVFLMLLILADFEPVLGLVMASSFAMLLTLVVAVTSMNANTQD